MEIYYENSQGEKLSLITFPYRMLTDTDLFNFKWDYATRGNNFPKISSISKQMVTKTIKLNVQGNDEQSYLYNIENLTRHFDIDIISNKPGKLYVNDCYLECYIYGSNKTGKYIKTKKSTVELSIVAENGNWKTSNIQKFGFSKENADKFKKEEFLDYPLDYPYDYVNASTFQKLQNNSYAPSNFELTIYGRCSNPIISIGEWNYGSHDVELESGEKLVINSSTKKVYKVKNGGEIENMFRHRMRDFYPFEKIPAGANVVGWNGAYSFEIELFEDRSEPKWT